MANDNPLDTDDLDNPSEPSLRRAKVVDLHRKGWTFERIGAEMGCSRQRAHQIYWEAMDAVLVRSVAAHRNEMAEQIAEAVRVANEVMHGSYFAHSNGKVAVHPETGQPLTDDAPRLDAARTLIAAHARLAKLLGADAPTQVSADVSASVRYEVVGVDPGALT